MIMMYLPHIITKNASHAFLVKIPEPEDTIQLIWIQRLVNLSW